MPWTCEYVQIRTQFACNARFLFCKDGAICAKNSPKRTTHGVARAIVKLNSLWSPSPIMAPDKNPCTIPKRMRNTCPHFSMYRDPLIVLLMRETPILRGIVVSLFRPLKVWNFVTW